MFKKNMSRFITAVLTATMIMSLTGCGADVTDVQDEVTAALTENAEADSQETETAEDTADSTEEAEPETTEEVPALDASEEEASIDTVEMVVSEADNQGNVETEAESTAEYEEDGVLQLVFIGDSIFDAVRDDTGIAHLVSDDLNADVYNLAIGGTTAGLRKDKSTDKSTWNEPNFNGVVYQMTGQLGTDVLEGTKSGEVIKTLDPEYTDYFIIEYGTNDFLSYIPLGGDDAGSMYFYFRSALNEGVETLQEYYPDAKIIICTPYYEEYWSADRTRFIGDVHSVNNGFGTLLDYISVLGDVAEDYNCTYLNMYNLLGIDQNNVNDKTVDGIHPSEETRREYADILTEVIRELQDGSFDQSKWNSEQ